MLKRTQSDQLFARAKTLFPGGVNSPVRAFKSVNGSPLFIERGEGAFLIDADGNRFMDFCHSWGPLIHGHNDSTIREAIVEAVAKGTSFGAPTRYGVEIGELITANNPYVEKLRFVSSGTEAVMSAIRLARGFTGKSKIVKFQGCYHGHVDALMVEAGSGLATLNVSTSAGIPEAFINETLVLPLNDLEAFTNCLASRNDIAAVIIEPIPANNGLLIQDQNYLAWLRKLCDDYGVLLIFDEVISGFRVGFTGAAGYYSIPPDLITYGKIIGGGMPVGAYGGRADIMSMVAPDGPVYQAGTLSANPVTLAAGKAAILPLLDRGVYQRLEHHTLLLCDTVNAHCRNMGWKAKITSLVGIFWLQFSLDRIFTPDQIGSEAAELFKHVHGHLLENGFYLGPSAYEVGFVSTAHSEENIRAFASALCNALDYAYNRI